MGYTHYFGTEGIAEYAQDQINYESCLPYIRDIVKRYRPILAFECDELQQDPEVTSERIRFNGRGKDGHETFLFQPDGEWRFCKTARKPYDLPVCECLLVLNAYLLTLKLDSDGFSGFLEEQKACVHLDGYWGVAIENVKRYGISYHSTITNERAPYCDLGLVLDRCEPASRVRTRTKLPSLNW